MSQDVETLTDLGFKAYGRGDVGEFGHLGDVEARQVADPVDHRLQHQGPRRDQGLAAGLKWVSGHS